MRRRDNTRQDKDVWVNLAEYLNIDEVKHIHNINEEDIVDFYTLPEEQRNYFIQYSVLPLKNGSFIVHNIYIRVPKFIVENRPKIYLWDKEKINKILESKIEKKSKLNFSKETKSLEAIKIILAKMDFLRASDITMSWQKDRVLVSYAINGKNVEEVEDYLDIDFANKLRLSLVNISHENQADKLIDGKFSLYIKGEIKEYRLSIIVTVAGYSIVIRSYDMFNENMTLNDLNYLEKPKSIIQNIIDKNPYGVFLITGPTGSGKTTTIYTILNEQRKKKNLKIKTAEDPVEVEINGIDQCQINDKGEESSNITYTKLIRSFMRQRPDIIAIGEIRDKDVAKVTIEAALTGHIAISTLHTNNVQATFIRLMDSLEISKDRIEDSLSGVLSQRLVDKLCDCKIKTDHGYERNQNGCDKCKENSILGYNGQVPAVEVAHLYKGQDNYLKDNFLEYYSYKDSAKELFENGLIDKKTKTLIESYQQDF